MSHGPEKLKLSLDELRMQMLGAQVLFGFQFQALFQELFQDPPLHRKVWSTVGFAGIVLTQGFLIAAPSQHRLAEGGEATARMERSTNIYTDIILPMLALALTCDVYVVFDTHFGRVAAAWLAAAVAICCMALWYGVSAYLRRRSSSGRPGRGQEKSRSAASLHEKIEYLLTEARVVLPGAQALLGFQFIVTLTRAFEALPESVRLVHFGALCCVVVTVLLLITPAAVHRIAFAGEDDARFLRIGSGIVTTALVPLAIGIAGDIGIAAYKLFERELVAAAAGGLTLMLLLTLWYFVPLVVLRR
jgi:hypothetical protein